MPILLGGDRRKCITYPPPRSPIHPGRLGLIREGDVNLVPVPATGRSGIVWPCCGYEDGSVIRQCDGPPPGALPSWACPLQVSRGGCPDGEGKDERGQGGVTTVSRHRCCPGAKDVDGSTRLQGAPGRELEREPPRMECALQGMGGHTGPPSREGGGWGDGGMRSDKAGSFPCHCPAGTCGPCHLTSLSLSFLVCKLEIKQIRR